MATSMMSAGGDTADIRQVMFTNLQILGLDSHAMEKTWRIPFNKEMFDLPNKKGFEAVMYFLFERLNPTKCKEEFRYCWKVQDKKDEHQFRKICFTWMTEIAEHDPDAQLPRFVASIFMSPGRHRFIHLLLHFSRYVLQSCITSETNKRGLLRHPSVTAKTVGMADVTETSLRCAAVRHRKHFLEHAQRATQTQDAWAAYAGELVRQYRGLHRSVRELEHDLRTEVQRAVDKGKARGSTVAHKKRRSGTLEYDFDVEAVKRAQKVRKVRDLWHKLSLFRSGLSHEKEVVTGLLDRDEEKYRIDGAELNVKVPDVLLRQQHKELLRRNVENVYKGGKLNLQSLIQLWNLSLYLYIQKFDSHGVPNFSDMEGPVTAQVHTHNAHLANAQALRMRIEGEMIPHLKQSIETLKRKLDQQMLRSQSPESIRLTASQSKESILSRGSSRHSRKRNVQFKQSVGGLGLLPPTPPMNFDPSGGGMDTSMDERLQRDLARPHGDNVSTPEAANQLMAAIDGKVKRGLLTQGSPANLPQKRSEIPTKQPFIARADNAQTERVGSKQRTRMRSAPTGAPEPHRSAPVVNTRLQELDNQPVKSCVGISNQVKQTLTAQTTRHKSKVQHTDRVSGRPPRKTKTKTSSVHSDQPPPAQVEKHQDVVASVVPSSPSAPSRLADQIAEAVISGQDDLVQQLTEQLQNPSTLLGEEAFVTRSRLQHSPDSKQNASRTSTSTHSATSHTSTSHKWQTKLGEEDSMGPLSSTQVENGTQKRHGDAVRGKLFSPAESSDEAITVRASPKPSPRHSPGHKSPKADLYRPAGHLKHTSTKTYSPVSLHSGWSSPCKDSPHVPRSPHGSRSFLLRSPPRSQGSTAQSSPSIADPRTGDLFGGLDSSIHTQSSKEDSDKVYSNKQTDMDMNSSVREGRDILDLGSLDQQSNERAMKYTGRDVLDNEYLTLIATDTPQLPARSRTALRNRSNNNSEHDSDSQEDGRQQQAFSLMTMTPGAGKKFAEQSARIVAFAEHSDLSSSRSRTPDDELMRRSLTGESEVDDDVPLRGNTQRPISDESLNRQTQRLLDLGLAREGRRQDDDVVDFGLTRERHQQEFLSFDDMDRNVNRLSLRQEREGFQQDSDELCSGQAGRVHQQDDLLSLSDMDKNCNNSLTREHHQQDNVLSNTSSSVDDLIERYKKLRTAGKENQAPLNQTNQMSNLAVDPEVDSLKQRLREIKRAAGFSSPKLSNFSSPSGQATPPSKEPVLESRYLQRTPQKDQPQTFALDLDDEEEKIESPALVTRDWLASGKENCLLGGGLLEEDYSDVLKLSPFQTPTATPKGTPKGTPRKPGEDPSLLVPSSPADD